MRYSETLFMFSATLSYFYSSIGKKISVRMKQNFFRLGKVHKNGIIETSATYDPLNIDKMVPKDFLIFVNLKLV
jgi:hypothetical protein